MFHGDRVVFVFFVDFPPGFRGYFRSTSFGGSAVCVCVTSADFGTDFGTSTRAPAMDNEVVVSHNLGLSIRVSPMMRCIFFFLRTTTATTTKKKKRSHFNCDGWGTKIDEKQQKKEHGGDDERSTDANVVPFFRSI